MEQEIMVQVFFTTRSGRSAQVNATSGSYQASYDMCLAQLVDELGYADVEHLLKQPLKFMTIIAQEV